MKSQLHCRDKIQEAADEDWFQLLQSKFMEETVKNPIDQRELRGELLSAYVPLCEMFKTYGASSSSVGTAHELEYTEFRSMVHDLKVFPPSTEGAHGLQVMLAKVFSRSHCPSSSTHTNGTTPQHFIQVQAALFVLGANAELALHSYGWLARGVFIWGGPADADADADTDADAALLQSSTPHLPPSPCSSTLR